MTHKTDAKKQKDFLEEQAKATKPVDLGIDYDLEEQEKMVRQMRLRDCNIPPRYREKNLSTFQARTKLLKDVKTSASNYIETFTRGGNQKGLFIYGCTGCGKSHIASSILKEVILRGHTGYWANVPDLMNTVRDYISQNATAEQLSNLENRCAKVDLLILDDLGAEAPRGLTLQRFYAIINKRYEANRPIIITTNLELDALSQQMQDQNRICSRLGEICTRFAPFPEIDYRLKNLK